MDNDARLARVRAALEHELDRYIENAEGGSFACVDVARDFFKSLWEARERGADLIDELCESWHHAAADEELGE